MRHTTTNLVKLALVSVLAIGASAIATSSASAAPEPVFAFCHDVLPSGNGGHGTYSDPHCETLVNGGLLAIAYAHTPKTLLLCALELEPKFLFEDDHCSRHTPGKGKYEIRLINEPTPLLLGTPINNAVLKGKLAGANVTISCEEGHFETQPEGGGKSSAGKLEYKKCEVVGSTKCKVSEPITAEFTDQLEGDMLDLFKGTEVVGTETEIFTQIQFLNKPPETCSLNNQSFPVKGLQQCEGVLPGINKLKLLQELECLAEGSKLTFGPAAATYENKVSVTAQSGEAWGVLLIEP